MSNRAWVTLATNDSYGLGALVLAHSLRRAASAHPAVVLITPSVTDAMRERLRAVFAEVVIVDVLDSRDAAHLALLQRPELGITFTKIHCWSLTQYEKCVFLDADTLIIQNCDELFDREELSAAPDVGWPDCFNSGVFVYKPSSETFEQLIKFAQERGSFDGGDQGLLNSFFSDWAHGDINKHLPFLYNVTSAAFYSYLPALKHYGQNLKIIHFIGIAKPWLHQFNWESRTVSAPDHLRDLLQLWWDLFVGQVHSNLDVTMVEVQLPPALPLHDVGQHDEPDVGQHYEPVVDPESEFPWHHPDAQIQEDFYKEEIDLAQFHDPWEIYRGRIPSNKEETASQHSFIGRVDDHEKMKKYAWEYNPQESITHHNYQQQNHPHFEYHHHQEKHSQHHPEHPWESHAHDKSAHIHDQQSHEHIWQHEQQHQHQSHDEERFVHHYHEHYKQEHDHRPAHSHEHDDAHSAPSLNDNDEYYSPDNHYNGHHNTHSTHTLHDHSHSQHHHDHSHIHSEHTSQKDYTYTNKESGKSDSHREEQVHHVRLDHEMILDLHKQKEDVEKPSKVAGLVNGDISESESDYYEEIRPRHPYDGFYLRHIPTVDAKGRKICLHEVPPTPSPSPPSDFELVDGNSDLFLEDTPVVNDAEEQVSDPLYFNRTSGVAGNLARVAPGALGSQRDALDELTRRQGWEAGNIDYMGADSFENIWAKISQSLSQPRVSPPKQPSPPKEQPKAPVEVAEEAALIDTAPSGAAPVTEAQAPGEAPVPVEVTAPTKAAPAASEVPVAPEVAAVVETPAAVESPTPVEVPVVVEAQAAVEATPQVKAESATPVVEPSPVAEPEPVAAAEIPATVAAAAAPAAEPLPVEPSDIPATVAAIAPGEAPQSTEAPASTDVPLSVEKASPEVKEEPAEKTETPLPPTPPVTPKSDPTTPVSESAPSVEPVVAKEETPAPVEAPVVPTTVEVQQAEAPAPVDAPVEVQKSEVPAPVAAPVIPVEASEIPKPAVASETPVPVEAPKDPEPPAPVSAAPAAEAPASPEATESKPEAAPLPSDPIVAAEAPKDPELVETKKEIPVETPKEPQPVVETKKEEVPVPVEVPKKPATPASPVPAAEAPASPEAAPVKPEATPEKASDPILSTSTDSPPLANTPSKEDAPAVPAAKSEERRKAVGKLQLRPPSVADPLPTPDSELEDAASLAQSIIASELRTPTVTAPESPAQPSPPLAAQEKRLSVEGPEVPTPPVGAVSLANIGVKAKPTIAAQIESSVAEKSTEPTTPTDAPKEAPKKKLVKKVKKDSSAEAPVPPPRKKEKKPKEK